MASPILAGAARVEITPLPGVELMGYGARLGRAESVHDPLFARALCLAPERPKSGGIALVSADLCLLDRRQAESVRQRISAGSGLPPERILVQYTHTHSAPIQGSRR